MAKYKILKIIDQFGWAYYFTTKEQQKYSKYQIDYKRLMDINNYDDLNKYDLIYLSSPDINGKQIERLCRVLSKKQIPTIGGYAGEVKDTYSYYDLIVSVSAPYIYKLRQKYQGKPVIYLPESIDTNFFQPIKKKQNEFIIGWAGGKNKNIKRWHLLDKLNYPVKIKSDHGREFFKDGRKQNDMLDFYHNISCLVLLSTTECQPRVVMEAMACGLPVISTDVGSIRLMLDKDWIVPIYPEQKMLDSINILLKKLNDSVKLQKTISKRNRINAERKLSWEKNIELWDAVFELVIKRDYKGIMTLFKKYKKNYKEEFAFYQKNINKNPPKVKKENSLITIEDVLYLLNERDINYVLRKEFCLNAVLYSSLPKNPNKLELGLNQENIENFKFILKSLKFIEKEKNRFFNKKITILVERATIRRWKYMNINGIPVKVQSPVVPYLQKLYGEKWRNYYEQK